MSFWIYCKGCKGSPVTDTVIDGSHDNCGKDVPLSWQSRLTCTLARPVAGLTFVLNSVYASYGRQCCAAHVTVLTGLQVTCVSF